MTVTIEPEVTYTADGGAIVRWSSDLPDPTFYVYVDGDPLTTTKQTSGRFTFSAGVPLIVDVFDDPNVRPRFARGATAALIFNDIGADAYLIERASGAGYAIVQYVSVVEAQHALDTGLLGEGGESFRVTPIIGSELQTPVIAAADPARLPYPPDVTMTFDAGTNQVTIDAA